MKQLTQSEAQELLQILETRFEKHMERHPEITWSKIQTKLEADPAKLNALNEMEKSGGEPDVVALGDSSVSYYYVDCAAESPQGRRSLCYDRQAHEARKAFKPKDTAIDMATAMGVELLTEEEYRQLQDVGHFDSKTSSWLKTPAAIRKLGGAIFGDYRYGTVFRYHNGADSYYASRGFRAKLKI